MRITEIIMQDEFTWYIINVSPLLHYYFIYHNFYYTTTLSQFLFLY